MLMQTVQLGLRMCLSDQLMLRNVESQMATTFPSLKSAHLCLSDLENLQTRLTAPLRSCISRASIELLFIGLSFLEYSCNVSYYNCTTVLLYSYCSKPAQCFMLEKHFNSTNVCYLCRYKIRKPSTVALVAFF